MKACPFCAEEIQDAAIICKHCHADLVKGVPAGQSRTVIVESTKLSPGVAALLSLIIPGAGQMYCGKVGQGLMWLVFTIVGYAAFIIPGLGLHLAAIVTASSTATEANKKAAAVADPRAPRTPDPPVNPYATPGQPISWKPVGWAVAVIVVLLVILNVVNRQERAAASVPPLVVTLRTTPTGWRVTNDSSRASTNCSLSIDGHSISIPALPSSSPVELASASFSDGGNLNRAAVTKAGVSMSCLSPERRVASIYLFQ